MEMCTEVSMASSVPTKLFTAKWCDHTKLFIVHRAKEKRCCCIINGMMLLIMSDMRTGMVSVIVNN